MASIDKIYGTKEQYNKLIDFLKQYEEEYDKFVGGKPRVYNHDWDNIGEDEKITIVNNPVIGDVWLALNCEFGFVIERLKVMYNIDSETSDEEFRKEMINIWEEDINKNFCNYHEEYKAVEKEFLRQKELLAKSNMYI